MTTYQTVSLFVAIVSNFALVRRFAALEKMGRTKAAVLTLAIGIVVINVVLGLCLHYLNPTVPLVSS